jgi:hypothetical protein
MRVEVRRDRPWTGWNPYCSQLFPNLPKSLTAEFSYLAQRQQRYSDKDIFVILLKIAKAHDILGPVQNSLFSAIENYG